MIHNPIIPGFHPDPSILRVDNIYYIAQSTFEWMPGISIYRSYDLKNWELISHALQTRQQAPLCGVDSACGVWAPALSYDTKNSTFYLTYSVVKGFQNNNFDIDNYTVSTTNIEGEWSEAIYLHSSGFDPSMFHDQDGRSYVVSLQWEFRIGYQHPGVIIIQEYDKVSREMIGEVSVISRGATERGCAEGPHLYHRGKYYYLLIAEGGTGYGHCVTVSRATSVCGPYEGYHKNPIITSQAESFAERGVGDSAKPWRYKEQHYLQKAGHGSIVETPDGEPYIAHLCSRPFVPELRSVLGRETAIQKCRWTEDGWITLEQDTNIAQEWVAEPRNYKEVPVKQLMELKQFDDEYLQSYFYTLREKISESWCQITEAHTVVLRGRDSLFSKYDQSLIARKASSFSYDVETRCKMSIRNHLQMAGLTNYYNHNNFYYLRMYYSETLESLALGIMVGEQGKRQELVEARTALLADTEWVYFKAEVRERTLQYYYAVVEEEWMAIGPVLDMTILSDEYAGGFTGSMIGLTAQDLAGKKLEAEFAYLTVIPK